jgi:hypothetical protein
VGQSLYGIFYPLNLPLFLFGSESCYLWLAVLHFIMAGFFTYLLLRRFGLSFQAALLGGLIFMCSTAMTARFHYYMTVYPMAWTPLMLFLVDRFHRDRSWLSLCGLSLLCAMIVLSGFQQVAIYVIYLCMIFSLFYAARDRYRLRVKRGLLVTTAVAVLGFTVVAAGLKPLSEHPTGVYSIAVLLGVFGFLAVGKGFFRWIGASLPVLGALALGVGLSAVQMAPVLTLMDYSTRTQLYAEQIVRERSLFCAGWLGFLLPALLDDPMWALTATPQNFIGSALMGRPDLLNYVENSLYLGVIPLALIGCLRFGKRGNGVATLLAFLCLIILSLAFGFWFTVYPMWWIPGFRLEPRRTLLIFTLLASLLAAFSYDRIRKGKEESAKPVFFAGLLLALAVVSGVAGAFFNDSIAFFFRNQTAGNPRFAEAAASGGNAEWIIGENARQIRFALLHLALAAALGGTALLRHALQPGRIAFCFMVFALLVDLVPLSWHVNGPQKPDGFLKEHLALELMRPASETDHFRIFRFGETTSNAIKVPLPGNMATHFGIEDGECYSVQTLKRYFRLVNTVQPAPPIADQGVWILPISVPDALRSPVLDLVGVRFLFAWKKVPEGMGFEEVYGGKGLHVYRNIEAFPRAFLVPEASFFDPDKYKDARSPMKKVVDKHVLMLNPDPDVWSHVLVAMRSPGVDLRSKVFLEAAPFEWERDEGPLPNALVRYPRPEEVEITFDGPNPGGILVLTDAFYPGWEAEVDGVPTTVMPADLAFRAVAVPRGSEKVVFRFDPPDVKRGLAVTLLSGVVLIACTLFFIFRKRRRGEPVSEAASE